MARKRVNTGGTTAPSKAGTGVGSSAAIGSPSKGAVPLPRLTGPRPSMKARGGGISARLKGMKPGARSKFVQKTMQAKYGKNWRQDVYGKKFKSGTVGKLNDTIKSGNAKEKKIKRSLMKAERNVSRAGDSDKKQAIVKRVRELEAASNKTAKSIGSSDKERSKYLDLRNRSLTKLANNKRANPKAAERRLKKDVESGLDKVSKNQKAKKKAKEKSISGGTTAR